MTEFVFDYQNAMSIGDVSIIHDIDSIGLPSAADIKLEVKLPDKTTLQRQKSLVMPKMTKHPYVAQDTKSFKIPIGQIRPLKTWKPAQAGALNEFSGILSKLIPELAAVPDKEIDEALGALDREQNE